MNKKLLLYLLPLALLARKKTVCNPGQLNDSVGQEITTDENTALDFCRR